MFLGTAVVDFTSLVHATTTAAAAASATLALLRQPVVSKPHWYELKALLPPAATATGGSSSTRSTRSSTNNRNRGDGTTGHDMQQPVVDVVVVVTGSIQLSLTYSSDLQPPPPAWYSSSATRSAPSKATVSREDVEHRDVSKEETPPHRLPVWLAAAAASSAASSRSYEASLGTIWGQTHERLYRRHRLPGVTVFRGTLDMSVSHSVLRILYPRWSGGVHNVVVVPPVQNVAAFRRNSSSSSRYGSGSGYEFEYGYGLRVPVDVTVNESAVDSPYGSESGSGYGLWVEVEHPMCVCLLSKEAIHKEVESWASSAEGVAALKAWDDDDGRRRRSHHHHHHHHHHRRHHHHHEAFSTLPPEGEVRRRGGEKDKPPGPGLGGLRDDAIARWFRQGVVPDRDSLVRWLLWRMQLVVEGGGAGAGGRRGGGGILRLKFRSEGDNAYKNALGAVTFAKGRDASVEVPFRSEGTYSSVEVPFERDAAAAGVGATALRKVKRAHALADETLRQATCRKAFLAWRQRTWIAKEEDWRTQQRKTSYLKSVVVSVVKGQGLRQAHGSGGGGGGGRNAVFVVVQVAQCRQSTQIRTLRDGDGKAAAGAVEWNETFTFEVEEEHSHDANTVSVEVYECTEAAEAEGQATRNAVVRKHMAAPPNVQGTPQCIAVCVFPKCIHIASLKKDKTY